MDIPIIKPEEMSETEITKISEDIKKEEKRRKKIEKDYVFTQDDIKELNKRLAGGEDLDEITRDISEKGIVAQKVKPIQVLPIPTKPAIKPTEHVSTEPIPIEPATKEPASTEFDYLIARAKKKEKKILRSEEKRIDYPPEECCSNVCNIINKEIEQYIGIISPDKDTKLKFDTLKELRRQFYIHEACQCANGHAAEKSGIPLQEKQPEDCCPKVCEIINNSIESYDGILFPTHSIRITSESLYDIRAKMFKNNACKCVKTEKQLKKPLPGGPGFDPLLQNKLGKLLKYAEKQGWIKDSILLI